jgi:hypothetical protein
MAPVRDGRPNNKQREARRLAAHLFSRLVPCWNPLSGNLDDMCTVKGKRRVLELRILHGAYAHRLSGRQGLGSMYLCRAPGEEKNIDEDIDKEGKERDTTSWSQ